jgi:hypothetical protein
MPSLSNVVRIRRLRRPRGRFLVVVAGLALVVAVTTPVARAFDPLDREGRVPANGRGRPGEL